MPKRDWSNGFASGLIVAICAIALLFVTVNAVQNSGTSPPEQTAKCDTSGQQCPQKNDDSGYWRGVTERFVSSEDTLAQWLMMVASLLAVGVSGLAVYWVKKTFDLTRNMTKDTREIGEAQVRSYIYANSAEIDTDKNTIQIVFTNFGNSPGSISFVECNVLVSDPYASEKIWGQSFWSDGFTLAPQDTVKESFRLDRGRGRYLKERIEEDGIHVCVQGKFQSVDVFKHIHLHGINIVLSDGVRG